MSNAHNMRVRRGSHCLGEIVSDALAHAVAVAASSNGIICGRNAGQLCPCIHFVTALVPDVAVVV